MTFITLISLVISRYICINNFLQIRNSVVQKSDMDLFSPVLYQILSSKSYPHILFLDDLTTMVSPTQPVLNNDKATSLLIMCSKVQNTSGEKQNLLPNLIKFKAYLFLIFILSQVLNQTLAFNHNHLRISPGIVTRTHLILVQLVTLC